jgi:hypothetical protein
MGWLPRSGLVLQMVIHNFNPIQSRLFGERNNSHGSGTGFLLLASSYHYAA